MTGASLHHLLIVPVVLPMLAAAVLTLLGGQRARLRSLVNVVATAAGLGVALEILAQVDAPDAASATGVYLASNWEAPFGIVLVGDRLSALMLVLVGVVSLGAAIYAIAGWGRAGVNFHPLFQIQLMGLNGAFLTGDLFNLFVFFEVALAASYGLHLHGSGRWRVHSGLHYIAVNLLVSSLFLVGLAMIYGVMGTLSMADVAAKLALVPAADRGLLHAGAALLAVAFLTKAAIWPLNSWLVPVYSTASPPVVAIFALMTKVGIYTILRLWTLLFSPAAGPSAHLGATVFVCGGLATIAFGILGLLASPRLGRIAGFSIIVSSGTLLTAIGLGRPAVTAAALYYLLSATVAASALFLLVELVERRSNGERATPRDVGQDPGEDTNLDDDESPLVGRVIPVSLALVGLAYIFCVLLVAGLPPLSGFVAKLALLTALAGTDGITAGGPPPAAWWLFGSLLASGLAATIALARVGIRRFWSKSESLPARLKVVEGLPVLALILVCVALTVLSEPVLRYTRATAETLHRPAAYLDAVSTTRPLPGPTRPDVDQETVP